jgi:hypothetical protein
MGDSFLGGIEALQAELHKSNDLGRFKMHLNVNSMDCNNGSNDEEINSSTTENERDEDDDINEDSEMNETDYEPLSSDI